MKFIDFIRTALKNFSRQKVRTFLTVTAITVGSLSLILMTSLLIGMRQTAIESFKKMGAFNLVTIIKDPNSIDENSQLITAGNDGPSDEGKKIDDFTLSSVKNIANVASATPTLSVWVKTIRLDGSDKKTWSNIMAYEPEVKVFDMQLLAGRNLVDSDMDKIVVGSRFLETYGYNSNPQDVIGKKVLLSYETGPGSGPDWGDPPPKPVINKNGDWKGEEKNNAINIPAEIVGIADNRLMNSDQNYITITWAKKLMTSVNWEFDESARKECENRNQEKMQALKQMAQDIGNKNIIDSGQQDMEKCENLVAMTLKKDNNFSKNGYGSIIIKVRDTAQISKVAEAVQRMGYGAVTAQNMVDQMNKVIAGISIALGAIGGISLFVAAIGIINTMLMAGYERVREIGVMRACGATKSNIRLLFTLEAAFLGFWGGVFGLIISIALTQVAKITIKRFGGGLNELPLDHVGDFSWLLVVGVIIFTTLIGLVSGLYPAIRASRLNPVEALRSE